MIFQIVNTSFKDFCHKRQSRQIDTTTKKRPKSTLFMIRLICNLQDRNLNFQSRQSNPRGEKTAEVKKLSIVQARFHLSSVYIGR